MRGLNLLTGALALALHTAAVQAAPSPLGFDRVAAANQVAFGSSFQSATLSWAHKAADAIGQSFGLGRTSPSDSFGDGDESKSIFEIINASDDFRQLAHILNYSSDATKEFLNSKDKKLTFFAPVNWHREHDGDHRDDGDEDQLAHRHAATQRWYQIEQQIAALEQDIDSAASCGSKGDDDDDKKRRREFIRHVIDAEAYYHLVRSDEPIDSTTLAANSSVASQLNTGPDHKFNDGTDWRVRVGKSLLPLPGLYLNMYSRIVKPDLKARNGLIHAIKYPLLLPPDVLQSLFFGQTMFSTTTSALQKVHAAKYLTYRPYHAHHGHGHSFGAVDHNNSDHGGCNKTFLGVSAETFFAPTNLAWAKLPFAFRAYLFSPWGYHLLQKVLMLHSLPNDIVYADFVHHVEREHKHKHKHAARVAVIDDADKTSYTFDSVLPSINGTKGEFETVDVDVYRYRLLPGGRGPLQTRVVVQSVPVVVQDLPALNGVFHAIDSFIKPKGHPSKGVWAEIAREAEAIGFGSVDLEREAEVASW